MARSYTLDKSSSTGWWQWSCKDGIGGGSASSKSEAKAQGAAACGSIVILTPPLVDLIAYRGQLASFTIANLDGKSVTFSATEIKETEFSFFFGLPFANDEKVEDARKVITILKIWGIYRGGQNAESLKKLHNLSDKDYKKLYRRQYFEGKITIQDNGLNTWELK